MLIKIRPIIKEEFLILKISTKKILKKNQISYLKKMFFLKIQRQMEEFFQQKIIEQLLKQ